MRYVIHIAGAVRHPIQGGGLLTAQPGDLTADVHFHRLGRAGGAIEPDDEYLSLEMRVRFRDATDHLYDHVMIIAPQYLISLPAGAPRVLVADGPSPHRRIEAGRHHADGVAAPGIAASGAVERVFVETTVRMSPGGITSIGGRDFIARQTEAAGRFWLTLRAAVSELHMVAEVSGIGDFTRHANAEVTFERRIPLADFLWHAAPTYAGASEGDVDAACLASPLGPIGVTAVDESAEDVGGMVEMPASACVRVQFGA
ncbi:MAG: hypothetical protein AB8G96_14960 [Phycisphaerales bacterium]